MRLQFFLSPNRETVPFDYAHDLTRSFHRLFPNNEIHDDLSLYSFSWLWSQNAVRRADGLDFPQGAQWFVSFHDERYVRMMLASLLKKPEICFGMRVRDVEIKETPEFSSSGVRFTLRSPALVKKFEAGNVRHLTFADGEEASLAMTQTLQTKLRAAGLADTAEKARVRFDADFPAPKTKLVDIHGIKNRASYCPVIVEGSPEAAAFAWNVGVGHSTGAGFGALR